MFHYKCIHIPLQHGSDKRHVIRAPSSRHRFDAFDGETEDEVDGSWGYFVARVKVPNSTGQLRVHVSLPLDVDEDCDLIIPQLLGAIVEGLSVAWG